MSGCLTCSSGDGQLSSGCSNTGGCQTGGCNKMNVFDWLSDMEMPGKEKFNIVEVRFKGGRKDFFSNKNLLELNTGDAIVVDVPNGHHIGHVSLQGELVRLQMRKKEVSFSDVRQIYRLASDKDIEKYQEVQNREMNTLYKGREIIDRLGLKMKLSDIEFQADNTKATFYYSAEERVDFRELIKELASAFKIRVDMRQISIRQEAGRLGGIGSCGRELCCSTWLTNFKSVSTSAARYQNLSLNPGKLSGQCGRLKCCLNYELDTYMQALEHIPKVSDSLETQNGDASLQKTDIFRGIMWFGFKGESTWHPITAERVKEIQSMNKQGNKPESLQTNRDRSKEIEVKASMSDLERMDKKYQKKSKDKRRKFRKGKRGGGSQNKNN